MTKAKELRELTLDELEQKLVESKHELFNLRFQLATGKQDNSSRLGHTRREIARVATILREREIDAAEAAEKSAAAPAVTDISAKAEEVDR